MPTILITGAANGLGAAFVDAYAADPNNRIIALDRQDAAKHKDIEHHKVDVSSQNSITAFVWEIRDISIDLLIHSAGIRGLVPAVEEVKPDDVAACETVDVMTLDTLSRTFHINAAGTFMLIQSLLPNLIKAQGKVVVMSSRMGSVGNNQQGRTAAGGAYAYRASKAALNSIVRSLAVDVSDVIFVLCHPGRVATQLVRCVEEGAITAQESVRDMLPLIERWNKNDSGKFYDRFGESIEW